MDNPSYILLPCAGISTVGRLSLDVSLDFAEKRDACVKSVAAIAAGVESLDISKMECVVVVDGCEKCCVDRVLKEKRLTAKYHLILSDLGFEKKSDSEMTDEDYELAIDGLEACCTEVKETFPRMAGACSCR